MADDSNLADREVHEYNLHGSSSRWRHQESSEFSKHAGLSSANKTSRDANDHQGTSDLANFFHSTRVDAHPHKPQTPTHRPIILESGKPNVDGLTRDIGSRGRDSVGAEEGEGEKGKKKDESQEEANATQVDPGSKHGGGPDWKREAKEAGGHSNARDVRCGPLLNYRRMQGKMWFGSVLVVVRGGETSDEFVPELSIRKGRSLDRSPLHRTPNGSALGDSQTARNGVIGNEPTNGARANGDSEQNSSHGVNMNFLKDDVDGHHDDTNVKGVKLYGDLRNIFWRFSLAVPMSEKETEWTYDIPGLRFPKDTEKSDKQSFWVPSISESFRIMFHSCNGFSVGTDEDAWSGPALWNDVQRVHKETPFHVMIGGGDQIYNDGIRVNGPLRPWSDIPNPAKRRDTKFPESLRKDCDDYYVANYIRWYSTEPFAGANGRIPQLNLWDDHDIIDGFGSYTDHFMQCDVFRGIGGTAHKYYLLFQHHLPPPVSTYTTDAPQTMKAGPDGTALSDSVQSRDVYVLQGEDPDPSYIVGHRPGPYVAEHSRSIYARLGARMAFFGIDARTERTRHQVNYPETYDLIFERLRKELGEVKASNSPIEHLIVLLGIPIAYPRLTWLENILSSPLIGPIKFLNKRFGVAGSVFNKFDGGVDLLDDLDDHYTARTHKKERLQLMLDLQSLAAEFSVRVTILGGDVHLAAVGRFYSNPKLRIATLHDHRYMANIVSSAIVNKPPPQAVANLLARRNKLHHLNTDTDETLLKMFDRDPGDDTKTASSNHVTMPSRNWAMITENSRNTVAASSSDSPFSEPPSVPSNVPAPPTANTNGTYLSPDSAAEGGKKGKRLGKSSSKTSLNAPSVSGQELEEDKPSNTDGHSPLHAGETTAGSNSRAVTAHGLKGDGSLDVCIRVEKSQRDRNGGTRSYGLWIPRLVFEGGDTAPHRRKRDRALGRKSMEGRGGESARELSSRGGESTDRSEAVAA